MFLESTPKRRKPGKQNKDGVEIFKVETHTSKQLRHFKYRTIRLLLSWCTSSTLLQQVCVVMVTSVDVFSGFYMVSSSIGVLSRLPVIFATTGVCC